MNIWQIIALGYITGVVLNLLLFTGIMKKITLFLLSKIQYVNNHTVSEKVVFSMVLLGSWFVFLRVYLPLKSLKKNIVKVYGITDFESMKKYLELYYGNYDRQSSVGKNYLKRYKR